MRDLSPVLIANRGEIAVRIARTVHALGLSSVAVFTDADAGALHVDVADRRWPIGSYLDGSEILRAAALTGARSVHPGYGFLSENAAFARAVTDAGLTWIGPPPGAIELMGDKGAAKETAAGAGVPVVPGGDDGVFPVIVKALAGGGGKGMRVVRAADELEDGDRRGPPRGPGRVRRRPRARRALPRAPAPHRGSGAGRPPRRVRAPRRARVLAPAPSSEGRRGGAVPGRRRRAAGADGRGRGGASHGRASYEGAGTVEFIAPAGGGEFFFLEMNTRLQVEHPVTELVYGVDLVEQQLRVAAGEELTLRQEDLIPRGHAIEARLYAEDPTAGFLPVTGTVRVYGEPAGVRVDSGRARRQRGRDRV